MPSSNTTSSKRTIARPKFRLQEAILILRQGKSHPMWREAAWHLMEHAGKDTQLLLEAQADLLMAVQPKLSVWHQYRVWIILGGVGIAASGLLFWKIVNAFKMDC